MVNGNNDQPERGNISYPLSRRRTLGLTGVALGSILAGCTDENTGGAGGETPTAVEIEPQDAIHDDIGKLPEDLNMVDSGNPLREWRYRWWAFNRGDAEVVQLGDHGGVAKDWSVNQEDGSLTVEIKKGYKWWDGTPLTAKHAYYHDDGSWIVWKKAKLRAGGGEVDARKPVLHNDYKLTIKKPIKEKWGPKNKEHIVDEVGNWETLGHPKTIMPQVEDLKDATTGKQVDKIEDKYSWDNTGGLGLDEKKPKYYGDIKGKNIGNGPWRIDDWSETSITLKPWEEDPAVKDGTIPIDTIKLHVAKGTDKRNQLLINDVLDLDTPDPSISEQVPEHIKEVKTWPFYVTQKVVLNWDNKHLGNRAVRRALWFLTDQKEVSENVTFKNRPAKMNGYIPPQPAERWLNAMWDVNYRKKLIDYGTTSKTEKATQYMQKAGYSKQDDNWVDDNGEQVSLRLLANEFNSLTAEILKGQFEQFGIKIELNVLGDAASYTDRINEEKIDMAIHDAGAYGLVTHPWWWLRPSWDAGAMFIGHPWSEEYKKNPKEYGLLGKKAIQTLPKEVGPTEIEGEGREVDLLDRCWAGLIYGPTGEQKHRCLDGSHYFNFYAHAIPLHQLKEGYGGDTKHFKFPRTKDAVIRHGAIQHVKAGNITPKWE